ncbi:dihydrolipoyllysine-residue acetyltransferase component of pyruvatedehydrogenase complex (E2) [Spirochaeta thermophila DSM 6192]|uniref:Dihydrolipoamide acetyltransferase component of pyruvate dehydrogenase complex n=2 Tax=Winmispira thermophila TaxID=154 RepID=E0RQB9_WINT6|nr:dihydrolipoyllysine-residue acetyltransferase component of pyruvatedehydrogenase complex (E2) [Spirochaeta thermophila DSM 6192]
MIALSPTMEEGTIVAWHKKKGERVESGDVLCEVETDKATMDYESTQSGVLLEILKKEGEKARVGEVIAVLGEEGEDISSLLSEISAAAEETPKAGSEPDRPPAVEAPSPKEEPGPQGAQGRVAGGGVEDLRGRAALEVPPPAGRVKASPLARKRARELGVDLRLVRGSGPGGRVTVRDVEEAAKAGPAASPAASGGPRRLAGGREPVTPMRAAIARRLSESKRTAPHFTLTVKVRADRLLTLREQVNEGRQERLSFNAFLMKLAAEALVRHPQILSSWEGEAIRYFDTVDIGLAVALPGGLITPVVRSCEYKTVEEIDRELKDLIARAREGGLSPEEYTGAGFTISNLGSYGITEFTAIINPPASAILAVGAVTTEPVWEGGGVVPARVVRLTLSCDHRTIDGAVGAAFMAGLARYVEEPGRALV